jgi:hypothetical protein
MKCPQCDFENEEGSKFCKNCNVLFSKQDYSEDNPYTKKNIYKEKIRAEVRAERAKIEKEKKSLSPISMIGYLVLLALGVVIYSFLSNPSTPTKKEETQSSIIHLNASVSFTGTQFIIKNNDNYDWLNVKMEVNGGLFKGGFILKYDRVIAGETYTVGALQFAKGDGTRLNPFVIKPNSFDIYCYDLKDDLIASWHGGWE